MVPVEIAPGVGEQEQADEGDQGDAAQTIEQATFRASAADQSDASKGQQRDGRASGELADDQEPLVGRRDRDWQEPEQPAEHERAQGSTLVLVQARASEAEHQRREPEPEHAQPHVRDLNLDRVGRGPQGVPPLAARVEEHVDRRGRDRPERRAREDRDPQLQPLEPAERRVERIGIDVGAEGPVVEQGVKGHVEHDHADRREQRASSRRPGVDRVAGRATAIDQLPGEEIGDDPEPVLARAEARGQQRELDPGPAPTQPARRRGIGPAPLEVNEDRREAEHRTHDRAAVGQPAERRDEARVADEERDRDRGGPAGEKASGTQTEAEDRGREPEQRVKVPESNLARREGVVEPEQQAGERAEHRGVKLGLGEPGHGPGVDVHGQIIVGPHERVEIEGHVALARVEALDHRVLHVVVAELTDIERGPAQRDADQAGEDQGDPPRPPLGSLEGLAGQPGEACCRHCGGVYRPRLGPSTLRVSR